MRKYALLVVIVLLLLAGCGSPTPLQPLRIKPVTSVATLPSLPAHARLTANSYKEVLAQATKVKTDIEALGGQIDIGANDVLFDCQAYFDLYHKAAALPLLESSSADPIVTWGIEEYNTAVEDIVQAGKDVYNHCTAFLLGTASSDEVSPLSGGIARQGVSDAVGKLDAVIKRLREELPDTTVYVGLGGQVLKGTRQAMDLIGDLGYEFDKRWASCPTFIEKYEQIEALPEYNITGADATVHAAYEKYRWAIAETIQTSRGAYLDCKDFMTTGLESRSVPYLTWTTSRKGVEDAMAALHQAEEWLKPYAK